MYVYVCVPIYVCVYVGIYILGMHCNLEIKK